MASMTADFNEIDEEDLDLFGDENFIDTLAIDEDWACEECGTSDYVREREDPYDLATHGESTIRKFCNSCYEDAVRNV